DRSFRWIEPRAALRVPWTASCLHLEFVDGHPAAGPRGAWVRVRAGGQQGELQLGGDWKELLLDLGPPQAPDVLVEIEAGPAFRPFSDFRRHGLGESRDIRKLAVALAPLTWSDCEVAAPASRPPAAGS